MRPEHSIAEAVSDTWFGHHGTGGIEIPVGVVASVLITSPQAMIKLPTMTTEEFTDLLRQVWGHWWLQHPHLVEIARPITSWLDDPSDHAAAAAKAVAVAAMRRRIKSFQGLDSDILSCVITELRSHGARKGLGEYHTPPDVCDAMAMVLVQELPEKGCSPTSRPPEREGTMHQIRDRSSGVHLRHTLTVYDQDDGMTEFCAKVTGQGVESYASVVANPEELSKLIDFLITTYNRHVDNGLVDTDKYPDPM